MELIFEAAWAESLMGSISRRAVGLHRDGGALWMPLYWYIRVP